MHTHVTALKRSALTLARQGAVKQLGLCVQPTVHRRTHNAIRYRSIATAPESQSSGTGNAATTSPSGDSVNTGQSTKQPPSSSGRDFLKFAYELHGIGIEPARVYSKEERQKQRETEAQARGFLPLAPLPEAPKYPCPYLSKDEIIQYLSPLYEQGWRIGSSHFSLSKHIALGTEQAPELAKEFMFAPEHDEAGIAFIEEVEKLQAQENHHCIVLVDGSTIHIRTHTHSARPLGPVKKDANGKTVTLPGITLRDIRLATLIEQAFWPFLTSGTARWLSQAQNSRSSVCPLDPRGIERLRFVGGHRNVWPGVAMCPVCGAGHSAIDCPKKHDIAPPNPCDKCGGMHWRFMCDA